MSTTTRISLLAIVFLFSNILNGQTRLYVNAAATGAGDGTTWPDAFTDLQDALAASQYGDEVWVAEGTYFPTQSGDRNIYFELKNGVKLLGGFAGTETQLNQRDWAGHPTILSGDIGMSGDSTDNSYTILYIGTSDTTTLADGLTLAFGNANGQAVFDRNPLRAGGGLYIMGENSHAYPRIWNCRFEHNYAFKLGGAAYVNGVNGSVAPQFYNCVFESNHAGVDGGAIRRDGGSWVEIKNDFWNCTFVNNSAGQNGGAILYRDTERSDTTEYVGCTFIKNNAGNFGGAVCQLEGRETGTKVIVMDCFFQENGAVVGGGYYFLTSNLLYSDFFQFERCTFAKNQASTEGSACYIDPFFLDDSFTNTLFDHCFFEMNNDGSEIGGVLHLAGDFGRGYIRSCNFVDNISKNVVLLSFESSRKSIVDGCYFRNNSNDTGIFPGSFLVDISRLPLVFTNNECSFNKLKKGSIIKILNSNIFTNQVSNCTFHDNEIEPPTNNASGNFVISNTIITGDSLSPTTFPFNGANMEINHSLLSASGCGSLPPNLTCGPGNLYNLDPLFRDTATGDFHLLPCSPARNAGSNAIVDSLNILTDIEGSPRIQGGTVDMGAYESPAFEATNVTVTSQPCGSGTGPTGAGTVSLTFENGCPPYFLNWGTGSSISDTTVTSLDLPIGAHAVTVTDGRMESDTVSVTITAAPAITATAVAFPVNCATGTGGTASVEVTGGTGGFGFDWTGGGTTASINGLAQGIYTVTVTDANGCTATDAVTVGTQGSLPLGLSIHPITCPGDSDGSATVQPTVGAMPFEWLWQGGQTTPTIDGLGGGTYSATVTDANGCTGDIDFTINPPTAIGINVSVVDPFCFGDLGMATATAMGGTGGFHYGWDTGATTANAQLPAGPHSVTATDANGCTATSAANVTAPPQLALTLAIDPPMLCHDASNGSLTPMPTGGTPPYGWSGPLEDLSAGTYNITITDSNGCTASASAIFAELTEVTITDTVVDASSPTASDGGVDITSVQGGTGSGYTFQWSNGAISQSLSNVPTGDYSLTITDSQGCTGEFSFFVDFNSAAGEAFANPFGAAILPNPSGSAGAKLVIGINKTDLRFSVLDALGREVVAEQSILSDKPLAPMELPTGLVPGSYYLLLKAGESTAILKWIVME